MFQVAKLPKIEIQTSDENFDTKNENELSIFENVIRDDIQDIKVSDESISNIPIIVQVQSEIDEKISLEDSWCSDRSNINVNIDKSENR